jgi:uncharacterized membrane protein YhaH (DUF805 family)
MKISIYTVQDKPIGRGGMGQVYLGTDPQGNRVAVKEMLAQYVTDPHLRQRFHQEVNILNQLEHPSIVKMYASFEERGNLYLVMEYVEGETIEQYVKRRGVLPEKEAAAIMSQILSALAYAHSKGFVHRDIKPSNIMIRPDGSACLLDFGIAKDMTRTTSGSGMTTTFGMTIGTVGYMSPEQAEGLSIDHRTDIYSIGCVLFYMLTGQHAVKEESNEIKTRIAIINNPFPKAKLYNPNISNDIQKILDRATHKNMLQRFRNCDEFTTALCRDGARSVSTGFVPSNLNGWGYFLKCIKQYADFKGRATRKEFWYFMLCNALVVMFVAFIGVVGGIVLEFHFKYGETALMGIVYLFVILYLLATAIPALAVSVRRLRDAGKSGCENQYLSILSKKQYIVAGICLIVYASTIICANLPFWFSWFDLFLGMFLFTGGVLFLCFKIKFSSAILIIAASLLLINHIYQTVSLWDSLIRLSKPYYLFLLFRYTTILLFSIALFQNKMEKKWIWLLIGCTAFNLLGITVYYLTSGYYDIYTYFVTHFIYNLRFNTGQTAYIIFAAMFLPYKSRKITVITISSMVICWLLVAFIIKIAYDL